MIEYKNLHGVTLELPARGLVLDCYSMKLPGLEAVEIDDTDLSSTFRKTFAARIRGLKELRTVLRYRPGRYIPVGDDDEMFWVNLPATDKEPAARYVSRGHMSGIELPTANHERAELAATIKVVEPMHLAPYVVGDVAPSVPVDIIDTATLRWNIDSSDNPISPLVATAGGFDLTGGDYVKSTTAFGAVAAIPNAAYSYDSTDPSLLSVWQSDGCTMVLVAKYRATLVQEQSLFGGQTVSGGGETCIAMQRLNSTYGQIIVTHNGSSVILSDIVAPDTDILCVARIKTGSSRAYINNVLYTGSAGGSPIELNRITVGRRIGFTGAKMPAFRDLAFWNYALSDSDFETLNSQLCTEYGI